MPEGPSPAPRAPSDPKPLPSRGGADWQGESTSFGSPARLQVLAVVFLGVLLVAVPLYLWRRPRAVAEVTSADAGVLDGDVSDLDAGLALADDYDAGPLKAMKLSDPRVLECRDQGSKKVPTEQCDALPQFMKSFGESILAAKDCLPPSAGPGSITYVADVSFSKRHLPVTVSLPKDGRSYKGMKAIGSCAAAVRSSVAGLSLEGMEHAHARYKIAIVATYPARTPATD
jgi:hypothetical protein